MKLRYLIVLPVVLTAACDDGGQLRKNYAQCELSGRSHKEDGGYDDNYMMTCMQSKGFILDLRLTWNGSKCSELPFPGIEQDCYRDDTLFAKLMAGL